MPIEQDSLIFSGRIDFAPCDDEIDRLAIIDRVAEFDEAAPRKNAKACSWAPSQKQRVTNDAETE
jgi:hypothetical protein